MEKAIARQPMTKAPKQPTRIKQVAHLKACSGEIIVQAHNDMRSQHDPRRPPKRVPAAGRRMTGGQAESAFEELELMKRAVAQRAGWSAAW